MTNHLLALYYGSPDQIIPLQTSLAAILAVVVMFWHRLLAFCTRLLSRFKAQPEAKPADSSTGTTGGGAVGGGEA